MPAVMGSAIITFRFLAADGVYHIFRNLSVRILQSDVDLMVVGSGLQARIEAEDIKMTPSVATPSDMRAEIECLLATVLEKAPLNGAGPGFRKFLEPHLRGELLPVFRTRLLGTDPAALIPPL